MAWTNVLPMWKAKDYYIAGGLLNADALEKTFPVKLADAECDALWATLDASGRGFATLADFDAWCNAQVLKFERTNQRKRSVTSVPAPHRENNGTLWCWGRRGFARAFAFGNSRTLTKPRADVADADYVTRREFYVALCAGVSFFVRARRDGRRRPQVTLAATHCALRLYRQFDAEELGDGRRVSKDEWIPCLYPTNNLLKTFNYAGPDFGIDDFDALDDRDEANTVLLDDVVAFFVNKARPARVRRSSFPAGGSPRRGAGHAQGLRHDAPGREGPGGRRRVLRLRPLLTARSLLRPAGKEGAGRARSDARCRRACRTCCGG